MPFSPEELRSALHKSAQQSTAQPTVAPPTATPAKAPDPRQFHDELIEFESALRAAHSTAAPVDPAPPVQRTAPTTTSRTPDKGFFNEFEQFLMREDLQTEGVLEQDVVRRMREFHEHRKDGKEFYIFSKDLESAAARKLEELKALERDWFGARTAMDELERSLLLTEHEIEARSAELKALVTQAKSKSRLERKAPHGQEFRLSDGRALSSLLELKMALRGMPDAVLGTHFHEGRNDFSAWARGTFGDNDAAALLGQARNREQLIIALSKLG